MEERRSLAVLIAVRNWSSRLPGKAMVDVCARPVLGHILDRFRLDSDRARWIVVATTDHPDDDAIAALCEAEDVPCYRQPVEQADDVMSRLNTALRTYAPGAEYVLRGMGDCPLADVPIIADWMTDVLTVRQADVVWVGLPDDPWPIYGARESPWSRHAWDECVSQSVASQREHPGAWIYDNLHRFNIVHTAPLRAEYYRPHRLELDTEADLAVIRAIYEALWCGPGGVVPMLEAIKWLDGHPDVAALNADVELKSLTRPDWRERGARWKCEVCGGYPMITHSVVRSALITQCQACGAKREFVDARTLRGVQ